jgi:hypothetical protein
MSSRRADSDRVTRAPRPPTRWLRPRRAAVGAPPRRHGRPGAGSGPQQAQTHAAARCRGPEQDRPTGQGRCRRERRRAPRTRTLAGWTRRTGAGRRPHARGVRQEQPEAAVPQRLPSSCPEGSEAPHPSTGQEPPPPPTDARAVEDAPRDANAGRGQELLSRAASPVDGRLSGTSLAL